MYQVNNVVGRPQNYVIINNVMIQAVLPSAFLAYTIRGG